MNDLILLPYPRRLSASAGEFPITSKLLIVCQGNPAELFPIAEKLQAAVLQTQDITLPIRAADAAKRENSAISIVLNPEMDIQHEGYRLRISPGSIVISAPDSAGAFYGAMTLKQMLRQCAGALPACEIEDWPDFADRGVMLDISRDKVPTMQTLFAMVDMFSELKINHLELYTEHTFAYSKHREVWVQADPMTGEQVLELDEYCRERFVELVPNQNSFGHMARWLTIPAYADLAETHEEFALPWGMKLKGPFSLNPVDPRSIELIAGLYDELLPHFSSSKFNVGCDETFDLGWGASKEECERRGKGRVYLDFLLKIYELVKSHGHTMHFWADIVFEHPELISEIPDDVILLDWGYNVGFPFNEHGAKIAETGRSHYVCPGTSGWASVTGDVDNAVGNQREAAASGLQHGAIGYLNTDWGDGGHLNYLPISYPGFAAGAAVSWCNDANKDVDLIPALDIHVFQDSARVMGKLAYNIGNANRITSGKANVYGMLAGAAEGEPLKTMSLEKLAEMRECVESAIEPVHSARMNRPDAAVIVGEYENAARMALYGCDRTEAIVNGSLDSKPVRDSLARQMRIILGEHRRLWTSRNRVGGLSDSTKAMEQRLTEHSEGK